MAHIFQCNTGSVVVPTAEQEAYLAASAIRRAAATTYHLSGPKASVTTAHYTGPYHLVLRHTDLADEKYYQVTGEHCDELRVLADGIYRICISASVPSTVLTIQDASTEIDQAVAKQVISLQPKLHVVVRGCAPESTRTIVYAVVGSFVPPPTASAVLYSNINVTCAVAMKANDSMSFLLRDIVDAVGDSDSFSAIPGESVAAVGGLRGSAAVKASMADPFFEVSQRAIIMVELT
jgi:hypothetical protein